MLTTKAKSLNLYFYFLGVPATRPQIQRTPSGFPLLLLALLHCGQGRALSLRACFVDAAALWGIRCNPRRDGTDNR